MRMRVRVCVNESHTYHTCNNAIILVGAFVVVCAINDGPHFDSEIHHQVSTKPCVFVAFSLLTAMSTSPTSTPKLLRTRIFFYFDIGPADQRDKPLYTHK